MKKHLFNRKGAAMLTVMMVMVIVLMLSTNMLSLATVSASRAKREFALSEDRMQATMVGNAFLKDGLALNVSELPSMYEYTLDDQANKLTVAREDGSKILEVTIDENGDLVFWREYYR